MCFSKYELDISVILIYESYVLWLKRRPTDYKIEKTERKNSSID